MEPEDGNGDGVPPSDPWKTQEHEDLTESKMESENSNRDGAPSGDPCKDHGDEGFAYNINWVPLDSLSIMDCLLTVTSGDLTWKSMPSVHNAVPIGECGKETLSVKLEVSTETISPLMYKYLKLEFHLYEGKLSDTRVAEALVYFNHIEDINVVDLSLDEAGKALHNHNGEAVARSSLIKVSLLASQVTLNTSTQQGFSLKRFDKLEELNNGNGIHGSRHHDLAILSQIFESQDYISMNLLLNKPLLRDTDSLTQVLQDVFAVALSADRSENPMAQWFPKSARSHDMPLGHVPRIGETLPKGLPMQEPLVRFHNEDQYMVTQIVGAANQAFAEEAAAQDVVSSEFSAHVIPLQSSNDNSQFIVIVKPKGHDIYLPTVGESCHIRIPNATLKRVIARPDVDKVTESILRDIRAHADEMEEDFISLIRTQLESVMNSSHDDKTILSLRFRDSNDGDEGDECPEYHAARIRVFIQNEAEFLKVEDTEASVKIEDIWFPATRMDYKLPKVMDDAQVYLASCPLETRDDAEEDYSDRKPISVELPFIKLDRSASIDEYMALVVNDEEQNNLTAFVRRTTSNKTIRAEVFAVNALHNPASATNVLIAPQSVEAFHYVQSFKRVESTPTVNLHEIFPVLRALSQPENQLTLSACPEQILSQYKKLDTAKKLLISRLNNLPAGIAFIPGVAGSGKTELIKFIVSACMFGQGTAMPVPTLYLAPNNQAVDDMAKKFQDYFEMLDLKGSPTIMRLYNLDFEVKSVIRVLAPGPVNSFRYFDKRKAQDVIQAMDSDAEKQDPTDRAYQFLAIYQFERMGLDMNEKNENNRSKRIRSTNICADTAAVAYYKDHIDKYRALRDILTISDRDGKLSDDLLKEARLLVKNVFHDMLADFKGIICTTSVVSANATVKRFSAEMVFIDEAARQSELSSLISFAHYQPRAWFFLGDTAQLKPYVGQESKRTDNPFIRQMSVSLLERAVLAGVELGWLDVTHRLRGTLRSLPSKINYGDRMKTTGNTKWNWPTSAVAFTEEMKILVDESAVSKKPSRVVVQFPFAKAILAGSSSMNITHVRWAINQVKKMLQNPQLQNVNSTGMAKFLILPLYRAQVDLYRKMLLDERIQGSISKDDYQRIEVRTLDSAQGEERDLVIVDYVQTHKAGFCVDPNRNCLATTRAQQCEILIINAGMISSPGLENSKVGQIIAEATHIGCVLKVSSCTNCEDPSHTDDDCPVAVKSCNWCKETGHSRADCPKVQCTNCRELGHIEPNCKVSKLCQQCGEVATTDHHKVCLGMKICSVCWKCHTGDPCEICFHCRGKGHKASACFHNPASNKTVKTRAINCNCCGEFGHKAGDCPNKPARTCHSCGSEDHVNKDCPTPKCKRCKQLGHMKKECPTLVCHHCGEFGHPQNQCQNELVYCKNCKKSGHIEKDCQWKEDSSARDTRPGTDLAPACSYEELKRRNRAKKGNVTGVLQCIDSVASIPGPVEANGGDLPSSSDQGDVWGEVASGDTDRNGKDAWEERASGNTDGGSW